MRPCDESKYLTWFDSLAGNDQVLVVLALFFINLLGLPIKKDFFESPGLS